MDRNPEDWSMTPSASVNSFLQELTKNDEYIEEQFVSVHSKIETSMSPIASGIDATNERIDSLETKCEKNFDYIKTQLIEHNTILHKMQSSFEKLSDLESIRSTSFQSYQSQASEKDKEIDELKRSLQRTTSELEKCKQELKKYKQQSSKQHTDKDKSKDDIDTQPQLQTKEFLSFGYHFKRFKNP